MLTPSLPIEHNESPYALHTLNILETPLKGKFERIIRLAKNLFDIPLAAVSLVDEHKTIFKTILDQEVLSTPLEISFCGYALSQEDVFVIPDTHMDARFVNNPFVTGIHQIRFYAGCSIHLNQLKLGTISIADHKSRYFDSDQLNLLRDLGAFVETELQNYMISTLKGKLVSDLGQARMDSMIDPLTKLWNRQGIYNILKNRLDEYTVKDVGFTVAILDVDHFKSINDDYGHDAGDQTLKTIADGLLSTCRETDAIGRWGGEEFLILINESNPQRVLDIAERIRQAVKRLIVDLGTEKKHLSVTIGLTTLTSGTSPTIEDLVDKADQALYKGKRGGRDQVVSG